MSIWEFMAEVDGFVKANTPEDPGKLSKKEADDLWDWLQSGRLEG